MSDLIVCRECLIETEPATIEDYEALRVVPLTFQQTTSGICPRCQQVVYVVMDYGELSFGV